MIRLTQETHTVTRLFGGLLVLYACVALFNGRVVSASHVSCGDTLTLDTTLDADLTACPGNGLEIFTNGITLDCAGFAITGVGTGRGLNVRGDNVTVRNCHISGFGTGIDVGFRTGDLFESNVLSNNGTGAAIQASNTTWNNNTASDNSANGFHHNNGTNNVFDGNHAERNGGNGFHTSAVGDHFTGNTANDNIGAGIALVGGQDSLVDGNTANNNDLQGFYLQTAKRNTLTNNTADGNAFEGYRLQSGSLDNVLDNNVASNNGVSACCRPGFQATDGSNTFSNNLAEDNGVGFQIAGTQLVVGNTIRSNFVDGLVMTGAVGSVVDGNLIEDTAPVPGAGIRAGIFMNGSAGTAFDNQDNLIVNNMLIDNRDYGILLQQGNMHNEFRDNRISGSPSGGIVLTTGGEETDNIFANNVLNNPINVNTTNNTPNIWDSGGPGRFVAFASSASNLVAGDTNGRRDIFIYDRQNGTITRASVASDGTQGNFNSASPSLSADGRIVAFASDASTLVVGDTNGRTDIFVHDRESGTTTRVSVASDGTEGNTSSIDPVISADGHIVAFASDASNLVAGDTNGRTDIFVHDRESGTTTRVSVASDGTQGNGSSLRPALSADGRVVAFDSFASNLVVGDTSARQDIFVHDRESGTTTRVSVAPDGTEGNVGSTTPALSADGRFVAFESLATNLVAGTTNAKRDIFVHDRESSLTTRVSVATDGTQGDDNSVNPALSTDGRVVAFESEANNLVAGDTNFATDIFVHDVENRTTSRVSVASDGTQGNVDSVNPVLSADGRVVAFESFAFHAGGWGFQQQSRCFYTRRREWDDHAGECGRRRLRREFW